MLRHLNSTFNFEVILYKRRRKVLESLHHHSIMYPREEGKKIVVIGAGPVGALAAIYASKRGYKVEVYELRNGRF